MSASDASGATRSSPRSRLPSGWGLIEDGAIVTDRDTIRWVGPASELARRRRDVAETHDLGGAVVTPGLVDCHTHLVYAGQRAREFELRLQGASYESIARAGGGIRSTVTATRAASSERLFLLALDRLIALQSEGVTTVEIKSGYGLTERDEAKCLRVARRLARERPVTVRTTYLAAHALPPEFERRDDQYIDAVCEWLTGAACRASGRRGRRVLRAHRLHARADAARVRQARARWACR